MASQRTVYDVGPQGDKWYVKKRSGTDPAEVLDSKEKAIARGRTLALANQPSQLVIRKKDGTIETEYTYGDDPFPPKG